MSSDEVVGFDILWRSTNIRNCHVSIEGVCSVHVSQQDEDGKGEGERGGAGEGERKRGGVKPQSQPTHLAYLTQGHTDTETPPSSLPAMSARGHTARSDESL